MSLGSSIGGAIGAWDNPTLAKTWFSKPLRDYLNSIVGESQANIPIYRSLFDAFRSGVARAGSELDALRPQVQSKLSSLFGGFIDPLTTSTALQSRDIKAVNDITGRVGDYATRQSKLATAALGGGRPNGSAANAFLADDVTRAALPLYQTVLAGNPAASASIEADRNRQFAAKLGILAQQLGIPTVGLDLPLQAAGALSSITNAQIGAGNDIGSAFRNNLLGTQIEKGTAGRIGDTVGGLVDAAMAVYTGGASGMMDGFGFGGGSGGGSSGAGMPQVFSNFRPSPIEAGSVNPFAAQSSFSMPSGSSVLPSVVPWATSAPAGGVNWMGYKI